MVLKRLTVIHSETSSFALQPHPIFEMGRNCKMYPFILLTFL
ncbi:hypothetical protein E2C01_043012 [Portunus trituberculatus]|uniref:Uncharacterized protein n=1 Tax=Portunus trituberculatus TaxID=210409 RepID=A0A5B7FUJ0_PORTR|nr:hypothetical protein [Portunus trituberculatus]